MIKVSTESQAHDAIFKLVIENDEVTWQSLLYELVRSEEMDPWNIDLSLLAKKYIHAVKKLREMDLRVSGKVILAAAILLKIKTNKLVDEDIYALDQLIASTEEYDEDQFYEELEEGIPRSLLLGDEKPKLIPRTPQPRKRKVSIYDLVDALEQALEVKRRRVMNSMPKEQIDFDGKKMEITTVIRHVYKKVCSHFKMNPKQALSFSQLVPSDNREDKIYTFIPLLHLDNQRKLEMMQQLHFGDIEVMLLRNKKQIAKELPELEGS